MSEFVVIAGMSGAGRSTASDALEDLGWFVIDNLPPALIPKVAELALRPMSETPRVSLVAGTGAFLDEVTPAIDELRKGGDSVRVLFLEAADDVLVRRYEGTRRRHPMEMHLDAGTEIDAADHHEGGTLIEAVRREREMLTSVKAAADVVIDTSDLNVNQLRSRVVELFSGTVDVHGVRTSVMSFGYKHGIPLDVDLVLDCRFLPNPHWEPELRPKSGFDEPVRDYVMAQPDTADFLDRLSDLLDLLLPAYVKEGKAYLTIAVGCTGGRHRSVVLAEQIAQRISERGFNPSVTHRDVDKR